MDPLFLSEIEKEASSQEEVILNKAEGERRRLLEEAKKEADRAEAALIHRTDLDIRKQKSRLLTQSDLEGRRLLLDLKSQYLAKAFEGARDQFDALSPREYEEVLQKFLAELVAHLDGKKKVILRVHPKDEKMARGLLEKLRLSAEMVVDPAISRGLELEDPSEHLRIRNTFESRLQRAHDEVVQRLNQLLLRGSGV